MRVRPTMMMKTARTLDAIDVCHALDHRAVSGHPNSRLCVDHSIRMLDRSDDVIGGGRETGGQQEQISAMRGSRSCQRALGRGSVNLWQGIRGRLDEIASAVC